MSKKKRKIKDTDLVFDLFEIYTTKPKTFIREIEKLCIKYQSGEGNYCFNFNLNQ